MNSNAEKNKQSKIVIVAFIMVILYIFYIGISYGVTLRNSKKVNNTLNTVEITKDNNNENSTEKTVDQPEKSTSTVKSNSTATHDYFVEDVDSIDNDYLKKARAIWNYFLLEYDYSNAKDETIFNLLKNKKINSSDIDVVEKKSIAVVRYYKRNSLRWTPELAKEINENIDDDFFKISEEEERSLYFVSKKTVDTLYKSYFNGVIDYSDTTPFVHNFKGKVYKCSSYTYVPSRSMYYVLDGCGYGATGFNMNNMYYVNNVISSSEKLDIYVSVGRYNYVDSSNNIIEVYNGDASNTFINVYNDVIDGIVLKTFNSLEEANMYKIDETNYNSFSEYKFTFKIDNVGNNYFESIEKVR